MPKILQKTLLKSIINYTCSLFLYYIVFAITNIILGSKYNFLKDRDFVLFFFIFVSGFFGTTIPDYIFIAPFSKKDRITLQKKLFLYSHFIIWIITSTFVTLPELVMSAINGSLYDFFKYLYEIVLLYFLLFAAGHLKYFNILNKKYFQFTGIAIDGFILLASSVIAAITMENSPGITVYIIMAVTGILVILVALYCYKKYFKNMIEFYSCYETKIQQKT